MVIPIYIVPKSATEGPFTFEIAPPPFVADLKMFLPTSITPGTPVRPTLAILESALSAIESAGPGFYTMIEIELPG